MPQRAEGGDGRGEIRDEMVLRVLMERVKQVISVTVQVENLRTVGQR